MNHGLERIPVGTNMIQRVFCLFLGLCFLTSVTLPAPASEDTLPKSAVSESTETKEMRDRTAQNRPELTAIHVGINGVWKPGAWTPVTVYVDGDIFGTPDETPGKSSILARLTVPDGDGVPVRYTSRVRNGFARFGVQFGRISTPVFVELLDRTEHPDHEHLLASRWFEPSADAASPQIIGDGSGENHKEDHAEQSKVTTVFREGMPSGLPIWLVVSREPIGIDSAFAGFHHPSGRRPKIVHLMSFSELPKTDEDQGSGPMALNAFERVIISARGGDILGFDEESLSSLMMWVWNGGRMLVMMDGPSVEKTTEEMGIFAPWVFERVVPLRETTELENLSGQGTPVPRVDGRIELAVPQFADPAATGGSENVAAADRTGGAGNGSGNATTQKNDHYMLPSDIQTLVRHGTLPLVQRRPTRLGVITWAGVAADDPAIARWEGRGGLFASLLDLPPNSATSGDVTPENETLIHAGFDDHAGQLRGSLDRFAGVNVPPFWIFVSLCVALILLVGPIDYFVGCRWLKRPGFVGLLLVGVAACVVVPMTLPRLKGDRLRLAQVELIDIDARTGMVRGNLWADFFSPTAMRLDLSFDTTPVRRLVGDVNSVNDSESAGHQELQAGWFGLPGRSLGGLDVRGGRWDATTVRYDGADFGILPPSSDSPALLHGMPVAVGATKPIAATWLDKSRFEHDDYGELTMSEVNRTLIGTVRNPLSVPIDHAMLVHGNWVWQLGTLPAGGVVPLAPMSQRIDRRQCLARPQLTGAPDDGRIGGTRYDITNTDPGYAIQAMMFHEALGGYDFTRLSAGFRSDIDSSALLAAGRAVLIGTVSSEYQTQIRNGATSETTGTIEPSPSDVKLLFFRWFLPVEKE